MGFQLAPAYRLAGFGAADFDHMAARRLGTEMVIEADHPMHLRPGQVEGAGDQGDRLLRHMAKRRLELMQDGQGGPGLLAMGLDDGFQAGPIHELI